MSLASSPQGSGVAAPDRASAVPLADAGGRTVAEGRSAAVARIVGVDALRGLCALAVIAYHFSHWSGAEFGPIIDAALHKAGIYGVEAFFIISGFSLYVASEKRNFARWSEVRSFFVRRSFRILPLLFAATLATAVMMAINGAGVGIWRLVGNMTVLPIVARPELAIATGAWSLGVEWGFYLLFPLLMLWRRRLVWMQAFGIVALAAFAVLIGPTDLAAQSALYVSVPNHLAFFLAGMLLGRWRGRQISGAVFTGAVAIILAAFALVLPSVSEQAETVSGWPRGAFFLLSVALVAVFAAWRGGNSKALVWLGNVSFGLYITHPLAFAACNRLMGDGGIMLIAAVLLTLAASTVSYYGFEKPLMRLGKRFSGAPRGA